MEILESALQMIAELPMCDHCLGRQFALLGYSMENESRGKAIKLLLTLKAHESLLSKDESGVDLLKAIAVNGSFAPARDILKLTRRAPRAKKKCFLCEKVFENIDKLADKAVEKLSSFEFKTFLVGIELPLQVAEREDEFKAQFNVTHGESLKSQLSRDIGKRLHQITKKEVNFTNPDLVILVKPFKKEVWLRVNPLFIAGRYRKLVRDIPQSRWLCQQCRGEGCKACGNTGKKYAESVEELVGNPILDITEGEEIAFHGAGREDVDARMLGSGRPFVLEVKEPKKRFFNLQELQQTINRRSKGKVEVLGLRFVDKDVVRRLKKEETAEKVYLARMEFDRAVSDEELERIDRTLSNATIHQWTPQRVLHRRSNLMREKYIYKAKTKRLSPNRAEIHIHCQGGLYIKELVTGDEGRTEPSVANILGVRAKPLQLDVVRVIAGEER